MRALLCKITALISMLFFIGTIDAAHAQTDWPTYRHDSLRTGLQPGGGVLTNIGLLAPGPTDGLHCVWSFPPDGKCGSGPAASAVPFRASPIVVKDRVFIGDENGVFYALDAPTGKLLWQYPKTGKLAGSCNNWGSYGIVSSATYASIGGQDAVIFGAPDADADMGLGSARLFALDFSGNPIWKYDGVHPGSAVVAHVGDCIPGSTSKPHERIAYSSPLILDNKVYVGIHDTGDNPLQQGSVRVVDLSSGNLITSFSYVSTGKPDDGISRGGGVWNALATDGKGIYFTTGNTQPPPYCKPSPQPNTPWNCPQSAEPTPNYGLSMLRVDKDSGKIAWPKPFKPVDFLHDGDPDWAAGATVMSTSCGEQIASVMKDGWSYGVNAADGSMRWQFPNTGLGPAFLNNYAHGDSGYRQPGAAWNDVFVVRTGGWALDDAEDNVTRGYGLLHALNVCAVWPIDYVRWIADLTNYTSGAGENSLGAPTVIGGFVYIGTDKGHLLVLADPGVGGYAQGSLCSNIDISASNVSQCLEAGYKPVPNVTPIVDFLVPDGGNLAYLRKEPVLSDDQVFVTTHDHLYALATSPLSITVATDQLKPNRSSWGTITISRPAPSGGALVTLSSNATELVIPPSVPIQAGLTSAQFTLADVYNSGPDKSVEIQASYNGASAYASLLLLGNAAQRCASCSSPARCCVCAGGVWDGRFCE